MSARMAIARCVVGIFMLGLGAASASAALIGNVGNTPGPHSITVNGTIKFTVSNFQLVNSVGNGGGNQYQAGDINIDLAAGGGNGVLLTFSKNASGPTPGIVFLANAGNVSGFTFSYDLEVTPTVPGSGVVEFTTLSNAMPVHSRSGNGNAVVQTIISPTSVVSSSVNPSDSEALTGQPTIVTPGNIVSITGNTGNASIGTFTNLITASFTPVPEPSCVALVGAVAALLGRRRRCSLAGGAVRCVQRM